MKPITLGAAITLMTVLSAAGGDGPFASAPLATAGNCYPSVLPGLGEIMILTQMRHIRLRYAAKSANRKLVDYELEHISENFDKAAIL
jgi:hypothetical protein